MKKIIALALLLVLLLPVTNVLASELPVTSGLPVYTGYDTTTLTGGTANNQMTDGNLTNGTYVVNAGGLVVLNEPITVTHLMVVYQNSVTSQVSMYDEAKTLLSTQNVPGTGAKTQISAVKNVKYVTFSHNTGTKLLSEVAVYGETVEYLPVTDLIESHDHQSVTLSWVNPTPLTFNGVKIMKDGIEVAKLAKTSSSHTIGGLDADTTYNFDVVATYSDGVDSSPKSISAVTDAAPPDTTPAGNITGLVVANTDTAISLMYTLPVDSDFSHLKIYRDGVVIQSFYTATSFDDFGLNQNTTYVYKITSVDLAGNESAGLVQSVTTDITPDLTAPTAVSGVIPTPGNGSGSVTWDKHSESDVSGYNVYVDGVKHNSSLVMANNYIIGLLENGVDYSVTITAVDTAGNESVASPAAILTPSKALMPFFKPKYDLADVATGTASWFDSLWLLLAFSVSIPLAFIIARRIKGLFLA